MTLRFKFSPPVVRQRRAVMIGFSAAAVLSIMIFAAGIFAGYRVNLTASEPLGLWRIRQLDRPVRVGDLVFVCPPDTPTFTEARLRGYLHRGLCPADFAPLIKTVIATAGQRVGIAADVWIDGLPMPQTAIAPVDGKGRSLKAGYGGSVPDGSVFLHSPYSASWDSRYFGPIPASGVLGLAQEVLTFAP